MVQTVHWIKYQTSKNAKNDFEKILLKTDW